VLPYHLAKLRRHVVLLLDLLLHEPIVDEFLELATVDHLAFARGLPLGLGGIEAVGLLACVPQGPAAGGRRRSLVWGARRLCGGEELLLRRLLGPGELQGCSGGCEMRQQDDSRDRPPPKHLVSSLVFLFLGTASKD